LNLKKTIRKRVDFQKVAYIIQNNVDMEPLFNIFIIIRQIIGLFQYCTLKGCGTLFWIPEDSPIGFLARTGDLDIHNISIKNFIEIFPIKRDFRFAPTGLPDVLWRVYPG